MAHEGETGEVAVFLSYAREDLATAERLAAALDAAGISVWWDRRLLAGQDWSLLIEEKLETARSVVVLWSQSAAESRYVRDEARRAIGRNVYVGALVEECTLPLGFGETQVEDLTGWLSTDNDSSLKQLVLGIRAKLAGQVDEGRESFTIRRRPFSLRLRYEDVARWWDKGIRFWNLSGADAAAPDALGRAARVLLFGLLVAFAIDVLVLFARLSGSPWAQLVGFTLLFGFLVLRVAVFATALYLALRAFGLGIASADVYVLVAYSLSASFPLVSLLGGDVVSEALRSFSVQGIVGPDYFREAAFRLLSDEDATTFAIGRWWVSAVIGLAVLITYECVNLTRVLSQVSRGHYRVLRVTMAITVALTVSYFIGRYLIARRFWPILAGILGGQYAAHQ